MEGFTKEQTLAHRFAYSTPNEPTTPEQFEAWWFAWSDTIKNRILAYGFDEDETDDIMQEIMIRFYTNDYISTFDIDIQPNPKYSITGYVDQAIRVFFKHRQEQRNRQTSLENVKAVGVEIELINEEVRIQEIDAYLYSNSPKIAQLWTMLKSQIQQTGKRNQSQIAQMLNVSPKLVSTRIHELRHMLEKGGFIRHDRSTGSVTFSS